MRPVYLTTFIGREEILSELENQVIDSRLITLTGPGGAGKTRLAVELSRRLSNKESTQIYWVDLAPIRDETLLPQAVANTLKIRSQAGQSLEQSLINALSEKATRLLLDNCEHLITACADLTYNLLQQCPLLKIIATSREPLGIPGERQWPVPPLSLPDMDNPLQGSEAVALFNDRAKAVVPQFTLTPENAPVLARICRRLDGLPLALELSASHVKTLTVEQIANRLDGRFTLLKSKNITATSPRHQTLQAAIDWSYELLSEQEQLLLRRLAVFAGRWSLSSVESVCAKNGINTNRVLELISSLVNKSLLVSQTFEPGEARYSFLETIHQFAEEKLLDSGEWSEIKDRHLTYYLQLAEETEPKLLDKYQQLWLNWLEGEKDNIRAALGYSLESGQIEKGLRIFIALYQFWMIRGYVEEGLSWLKRLLAGTDTNVSAMVHASALAYASFLAGARGNAKEQIEYSREAQSLAEVAGEQGKPALAWALVAQAFGSRAEGDYQTAYNLLKRSVQLRRELNDFYQLGLGLSAVGMTAIHLGKYSEARAFLEEGLIVIRQLGNPYRIAMILNYSGDLARCEGEYERAKSLYEESISLLRELDAVRDLASALHNLGLTCLKLEEVDRAKMLFEESLALQVEQGNTVGTAECLLGFAALAIVNNFTANGARLLAAAAAIGGRHITSAWPATSIAYEHYLDRVYAELPENTINQEQVAGEKMSLEQAVDLAHAVAQKTAAAQQTRNQLNQLTPREREVATLIAQGKSNDQIAEDLVVSKRTVEKHIANIRSKLSFTERTQIVRWAIESGLATLTK